MNPPIYEEVKRDRAEMERSVLSDIERLNEPQETSEVPPVRLPWWWRLLGRLGLWPQ